MRALKPFPTKHTATTTTVVDFNGRDRPISVVVQAGEYLGTELSTALANHTLQKWASSSRYSVGGWDNEARIEAGDLAFLVVDAEEQ